MKNFGLISYIVLLICLRTTINSQQVCPTFFTGTDLQGSSFHMCSSGDVPSEYNNLARSVYVPPGYLVQLYEQISFDGQSLGSYTQGSYSVLIVGLSSVIVSSVQTQTQTQTSSQTCPTFYRNEDRQGDSFQMCWSGEVPNGWNDQVSSFSIPAGYLVLMYKDSGYNGQSIGPYGQGSSNLPVNFDKQLTSVIVSQLQNCPTFYTQSNQQGDSFRMCSSGDVPSEWNDRALSLYVPSGYSVQLFKDSGFSENLGSYTQGSYSLLSNLQLSSVMVSQNQSPAGTVSPKPVAPFKSTHIKCPTFYRDIDHQGDSFTLCSSGDVPAPVNGRSWNNQVSSFYVPPGYYVKLYPHPRYGGWNFGRYSQGFYNVPSNYDNQLSSVVVTKR